MVNYEEGRINNNLDDLDMYQKVSWAWEQLNTSLEEMQNIVSKKQNNVIPFIMC